MREMKALVLRGAGQMAVESVPGPGVSSRDVLVGVVAVGLCGTDWHIYSGEANYHFDKHGAPVSLGAHPQILGHEIVGEIVEMGRDCPPDLSVGDRVVVDQGLNCYSRGQRADELCEYCSTGDSHQCDAYAEHGITGLPGGLADYLAVPAVNVIPWHSSLDAASAALTEPLGCVLHALSTAELTHSRYRLRATDTKRRVRSVLICGAGPSGLLFIQVLRHVVGFGGEIFVSEPNEAKRLLAQRLGATTLDPASGDLTRHLAALTKGRMCELVLECSGNGPLFATLPGLIRKQATVLLYGHGHAGASLECLNALQWREPTLVSPCGASGSFDPDHRPSTYRQALALIEAGQVSVDELITHRYMGLRASLRAFEVEHRAPGYIKGVVHMQVPSP